MFQLSTNVSCFWLSTHMSCLYPRITCFPVYTVGTSCPRNPWLRTLSKVNIQHTSTYLILQKMHKDDNSKNITIIIHLRKQSFNQVIPACSSYFFILSYHGWLSHMHTSKLQYNHISHLKKNTIGPLSTILWGSQKHHRINVLVPKSWSQTLYPWSFQQHFLPGFFMTTHQSSTLQVPTWNNWGIS